MITPCPIGFYHLHLYQLNDFSLLSVGVTFVYFTFYIYIYTHTHTHIAVSDSEPVRYKRRVSVLSLLADCTLHIVACCPVREMSIDWVKTFYVFHRSRRCSPAPHRAISVCRIQSILTRCHIHSVGSLYLARTTGP